MRRRPGFGPRSAGLAVELQLTLDRVPIHRVVLLADQASDTAYLEWRVQLAWSRPPRRTDRHREPPGDDGRPR